jgi:hypothetical protein
VIGYSQVLEAEDFLVLEEEAFLLLEEEASLVLEGQALEAAVEVHLVVRAHLEHKRTPLLAGRGHLAHKRAHSQEVGRTEVKQIRQATTYVGLRPLLSFLPRSEDLEDLVGRGGIELRRQIMVLTAGNHAPMKLWMR